MKKIYLYFGVIAFLVTILFLYSFIFKGEKGNNNILKIGMMNGWPPFMNINKFGEMEGFDVDVANLIKERGNCEVVIKDLGCLSSLFIGLEQGSVDLILSGLDITKNRKENYDVVFYGDIGKLSSVCVITSKNGPKNEDDLKNKLFRVGVESGSSLEKTLNQYKNIKRVDFTSITDMVLQLRENRIDCFIIDPTQCNRLKEKISDLEFFKMPLHESILVDGIGILMKKNNIKIKEKIENIIIEALADKSLEKISKKWNLE
jgi:polar amino acid transport system substrate-binding protein